MCACVHVCARVCIAMYVCLPSSIVNKFNKGISCQKNPAKLRNVEAPEYPVMLCRLSMNEILPLKDTRLFKICVQMRGYTTPAHNYVAIRIVIIVKHSMYPYLLVMQVQYFL